MKPKLHIIKTGGKLLEDDSSKQEILSHFANIPGPKILVHGGGSQATRLCQSLGITPQLIEGRRITDGPALEVAIMVYAGLINKTLVGGLQALGCNAIGICGADLDLIRAEKRKPGVVEFGLVGDITKVDALKTGKLLQSGAVPVFCAITHDGKGQLLNTNADTIAAEIASAMSPYYQTVLKFCFDKTGVLSNHQNDQSVLAKLNIHDFKELQKSGKINAGMIPKLDNGFRALKKKVDEVVICGIAGLAVNSLSKGTELCLN